MNTNPLSDFMGSIDEMTIAKKTTLLFLIMVVGMFFIGSFAHMSINRIKNNFDILYTKRMLPTIRLENLKDIYTVNVLDTIRDIEKGMISAQEGKTVIALAQELIKIELQEYKNSLSIDESDWLIKLARSWGFMDDPRHKPFFKTKEDDILISKIEQKIHTIDGILLKMFNYFETKQSPKAIDILQNELYPSVYSINIDLTGLINLNLDSAKEGYARTEKVYDNTFEWIVVATIGTIAFAALLAIVLLQNIRLLHARLAKMVDAKTYELQQLNRNLELKVQHEVDQSRQKDQIMFRQSRLASMGEMIGNIAHQWRQPLNAIVLIIQSFQMKRLAGIELSDEFIDRQVKEGIALASLMSHTIDDFRNFFKPNKNEEHFSVKDTVEYSLKLVKAYYAKSGIDIFLNCTQDVQISGYPNEFSQVLMNLFSNAKDVLEERNIEEKYIEIIITKQANNAVISVIDNGGGISEEVQDRMFEPYFTTKHKSSGTGIGLYMSKQIIEKQMRGSIIGTNISYVFSNGKRYEKCAIITILVPLDKKEDK
ncbi:MCP four helix bundle domain-containing protein [Sulfurospirillum diekertiae]|uniref:histidine kinase n=1 Tax=Sulfurospirillum diekertiae TaxID=1854492 RepID=A0A290H9Y5_9BACT|nr:ATP-binding protein [Sulfurospirillum diekertiae]ATB68277.1 putative two-component histidine kinase [Sulfurospirillum diekertiae]QIR76139.1 MCP four helix bundle domain-containing protein [Sulfurospirillum diekertiae]QIR78778.1 MCP four helix bundle domain-containing protein [Sulfurospirillum diekertiae]